MRYVNDEQSLRQYTEFLSRHERCNFQQSPEWARVKSGGKNGGKNGGRTGWKNEIILAEDGQGHITGGMSVLIRKMPLFGNLMYCARGPVCATNDESSLRQLIEGAELLAWKYNAMALRMEPDVSAGDGDFRAIVESLGCKVRDKSHRAGGVIQPRSVFRLDIAGRSEEQILADFSAKLRYNIRLAQRRGVVVREGTREDLPVFHALMAETARRDGFLARPLAYFERVWDEMGPEHMTLLLAYFQDEPIAGAIPIFYGNKTWYAFGASSDRHRSVMPNYLLQWEMIRRAAARGDEVYDLRGVLENTDLSNGLYLFKRRFGGELTRFIGEVYVPYKPAVYRAYRLAERLYMHARGAVRHTSAPAGPAVPEPEGGRPHPLPWDVPMASSTRAG